MAKEFSVTRDGTQIISMMLDRSSICSVMRDLRIKLAAKTVDEDPASCKRWTIFTTRDALIFL